MLSLSTIRKIGAGLGFVSWHLGTRMAKTTQINLELCFPELSKSERDKLGKQSLQETFKTLVEMGPAWLWSSEKVLEKITEIEGIEKLKAAYSQNKGVVVISPHIGNWEVIGLYLNTCGCGDATVMYQAPKDPNLDKLIQESRSRSGIKLAATDSKGVGRALASLRRGELMGILPDQVPPISGGEYSSFFGIQALTMTLIARLLNKTGAKAVFAYAVRDEESLEDGFKLVFKEFNDGIYAEHITESLRALNDAVEEVVRSYPKQYQWEYKRFKRQPKESKQYYKGI